MALRRGSLFPTTLKGDDPGARRVKPKPAAKGKDEEPPALTLGSKFRVVSLQSRDHSLETKGTFRGVTTVGSIDALALETEDGKIRVIPSHMVLSIDIVEAVKDEEKPELGDVHYG